MKTLWILDTLRRRLQEWVNSPDFVERFLDEVLAFPFLEMERGSVFFFDEKKQLMVLIAARSSNGMDLIGLTRRMGEGVAGHVARERKPLLVVSRDAAPVPLDSSNSNYETESFICAPILSNDRLIGVLNLTEKKSRKPFNETDLDIVTAILDQFSTYIEQAFQQRDLREKIKKLEETVDGSQRKAGMGEMVESVAHEINSALETRKQGWKESAES
jgi:GAF domain-containing protein